MAVGDLKNKAREALKRKQYQLAVEMVQEYIGLQPDDEDAMDIFFTAAHKLRETRGKSLLGGGLSSISAQATKDPKKRIASCLRGLAKRPDHKGTLMMLGQACLDAGAFGSGVVAYKRAAEAAPDDPQPWKRLGEALGRRGRIKEALDALSEAVRIAPRDQEALKLRKNLAAEGALKVAGYETAASSRDLIKDKDAAKELEQEVRMQLTPEHAATELEKALADVEASPEDARLHVRVGDLHLQKGDEAAGLAAFEQALQFDPQNYDLSVRIGDLRLRPLKLAAAEAKKAHDAAPDDATQAAFDAAMDAFVKASLEEHARRVKEHPLDLNERFQYGRFLFQDGRVDEALAEFQQTVRDPNRKIQSLRFQAKCFEQKGILNLAAKKMEEASQGFPTMSTPAAKDTFYDYADLLERQGNRDQARAIFERIVEADASYRDVLERLARLSEPPPAAAATEPDEAGPGA